MMWTVYDEAVVIVEHLYRLLPWRFRLVKGLYYCPWELVAIFPVELTLPKRQSRHCCWWPFIEPVIRN